MMLKRQMGGWLLAATLLPGLAFAADEPNTAHYWLQRMATAAHQLNYEGTFVYSYQGHMETMRIVHGDEHGKERERLLSLSGPSREVLRDDEKVTCILPDDNQVVVEHTSPNRLSVVKRPSTLDGLDKYYAFKEMGGDRVAGFPAIKLVITPRDRYRYGHIFWLNKGNGLLLRSQLENEDGKVVEQMMFTTLRLFKTLPVKLLQPETKGHGITWQRELPAVTPKEVETRWTVTDLPPGFVLYNHERHVMPSNHAKVDHLIFSDGLASVSVFVEKEKGNHPGFVGSSGLGAVNVYARIAKGYHITVVGEVPEVTVKQMADSVVEDNGQNR